MGAAGSMAAADSSRTQHAHPKVGDNPVNCLRFVAPDGTGSGKTIDDPGAVSDVSGWIAECNTLAIEFLPGTYSDFLHISDVPSTKRVMLHGDSSGQTVFMSKDSSLNGSITLSNCHNVSIHHMHFRQTGRDLKSFLNVVGCQDCLIHRCSWRGLSCRFGAATIHNESQRITISDCCFEDTGNRESSGSGSHQLYISGGGDAAADGHVRDIHVIRCTFADHFGGQHLKFKNGARDCFVNQCSFLRTDKKTFARYLNIRNVGNPGDAYPRVTNIFVFRCLFKDVTGDPSTVVNPAPTGRPKQYVFALNEIEGSVSGLPSSV